MAELIWKMPLCLQGKVVILDTIGYPSQKQVISASVLNQNQMTVHHILDFSDYLMKQRWTI